jgi:hypothetical protein
MNWESPRDWLDNPIFVKHLRSRLRPQPLAASAVVVMVLCMCIAWAGYQLDGFANGRAFEWLIVLQGILLIVMGASQVSSAVGSSRASGILDFHRVSPLTPSELVLGFFFGAPIREYVLFACTLPFAALFLAFGVPSAHGFIQIVILLMAIAWLFHGLALLNALITKGHRGSRGAVGVVLRLFPAVAGRCGLVRGLGTVLHLPGRAAEDGCGADSPPHQATGDRGARSVIGPGAGRHLGASE